jgi:hypothetical protein
MMMSKVEEKGSGRRGKEGGQPTCISCRIVHWISFVGLKTVENCWTTVRMELWSRTVVCNACIACMLAIEFAWLSTWAASGGVCTVPAVWLVISIIPCVLYVTVELNSACKDRRARCSLCSRHCVRHPGIWRNGGHPSAGIDTGIPQRKKKSIRAGTVTYLLMRSMKNISPQNSLQGYSNLNLCSIYKAGRRLSWDYKRVLSLSFIIITLSKYTIRESIHPWCDPGILWYIIHALEYKGHLCIQG